MSRRAGVLGLALGLLLLAGPLGAQSGAAGRSEVELLRAATMLERSGQLEAAEARVRQALDARAASVPALLQLERLLRVRNRLAELVPALERALDEEPDAALIHQLRLRTLSALDREAELADAADAWIAASPALETPYREIAGVWVERGRPQPALDVLERGRRAVGSDDALALEIARAAYLAGGVERALEEWTRAVDTRARGWVQVQRSLRDLPQAGDVVLSSLVAALLDRPTPTRERAALELALDAGLEQAALRAAPSVVRRTAERERPGLLVDVARRADGAGLTRLAYWAYDALLPYEPGTGALAVHTRLAELALELGDTTAARESFRRVEATLPAGAPERRTAGALRIRLLAQQGEAGQARDALASFRSEFADAAELDELAAAVAGALLAKGDEVAAAETLTGVKGPRSALLRGRLALASGSLDLARTELMRAAAGLSGTEATELLALVAVLERVGPPAGLLVGRALQARERHGPARAVAVLADGVPRLPARDQAPVLELAASVAERGELAREAARLRRRIVEQHPASTEAPAALLGLARSLRGSDAELTEAKRLLERLILDYPKSALVPQARRELERLNASVPVS